MEGGEEERKWEAERGKEREEKGKSNALVRGVEARVCAVVCVRVRVRASGVCA